MSRNTFDVFPDDVQVRYELTELERAERLNAEAEALVVKNETLLASIKESLEKVELEKVNLARYKIACEKQEVFNRETHQANVLHSENLKEREEYVKTELEKLVKAKVELEISKTILTAANAPILKVIEDLLLTLELEEDPKVVAQELRDKHDLYAAKW